MNQAIAYIESLFTSPGSARTLVGASLIGGLVSWNWVDFTSKKQQLFALLSGCAMASFISEPVADFFSNGNYIGFVAFNIGMFGRSVVGMLFKLINTVELKDIMGMIERLFGRLIDKIPSKEDA